MGDRVGSEPCSERVHASVLIWQFVNAFAPSNKTGWSQEAKNLQKDGALITCEIAEKGQKELWGETSSGGGDGDDGGNKH